MLSKDSIINSKIPENNTTHVNTVRVYTRIKTAVYMVSWDKEKVKAPEEEIVEGHLSRIFTLLITPNWINQVGYTKICTKARPSLVFKL